MLLNCPAMGRALKLPNALVRAELTPRLEPRPAMAPAPGRSPAPAMLITALRGPPQLMLESYDHIRTTSGHESASCQIRSHERSRTAIDHYRS
jgi:hypothetical protein